MSIFKEPLFNTLSLFVVVTTLIFFSNSAQARIKCWENNEGIRECGQTVPPEYSQKGHKEISSQGLVLEEAERVKTEEERQEEERLIALQEEEERKKEEALKQDKILLDTYSNTDDIQMTSDGKLAALESTIKLANKRNEKLQTELDKQTAAAAASELAGKQPSEAQLKDIRSLQRQIGNNTRFIEDKHAEQEEIKRVYAEKIERYEELTGKSKKP